jgi:hypothetical protein
LNSIQTQWSILEQVKRNRAMGFDYEMESSSTNWVRKIKWWHSDLSWSSGVQHGYQASAL